MDLKRLAVKPSTLDLPGLIMLMGPFGSGKTYFAASASDVESLAPVAYIDVEGSTNGTVSNFDDNNIDIFNLQAIQKRWNAREVEKAKADPKYEMNRLSLFGIFDLIVTDIIDHNDEHGYKTIVIDTLDGLNTSATDDFDNPGNNYERWAKLHSYFTDNGGIIDRLKQLDALVILVMHEAWDQDKASYEFSWSGAKSRTALPQFPDLVMRINRTYNEMKKAWVTKIVTAPTDRGQAKSRFLDRIPPVIEGDLTMSALWDMLNKNKGDKK